MSLPRDIEGVRVLAERLGREHVASGGKVVGYITPSAPTELIEAAGMRPIMLSAGAEMSTTLGDRYMEDLFDTALRGVFERLLKAEFDWLSAIVIPRANDSAHRLYYYLSELKRTGEAKLPPVLLCDVVMTPDAPSRRYSIDALGRLWNDLRAIGAGAAGEAELRAAIRAANQRADWLLNVVAVRRTGAMPGAEALAMYAAAHMLPWEVLAVSARREVEVRAGVRVMVCGSVQDGAGLHGVVEAGGGMVVGDCHAGGELSVRRSADERGAPLEAIADRLREAPAASRGFGDPAASVVEFARGCRADAAIFSYFPEEEALTWDYPEQKRALEAIGVRVLRLAEQARPFDVEVNRAAVEAFLRGAAA